MRRIVDLFWNLMGFVKRKKGSALRARERLEVIVLCDRISLDQSSLESLKTELIKVVAQYLDIERDNARLEVARDRSGVRLVAVFPVRRCSRIARA